MIARLTLLAALLTGCTESGNSLDGSLSQVYRIAFQSVRARLYSSSLAIEYVGPRNSVPVRVTVSRTPLEGGERNLELAGSGDISGQLPDGTFIPRFESGSVSLDAFGLEAGSPIEGGFDAMFRTDEETLGLAGRFQAELEVVEGPNAPSSVSTGGGGGTGSTGGMGGGDG